MAEVDQISSMLSKSSVDDVIEVSFAGRKLKLDSKGDAEEIVTAIKTTANLTALRLDGNTLGLEASIVIAEALEKQPNFQRALWSDIFTGRLRSEIPPSLEHLSNGIITAGARLVELDLSDNAFGPDGVKGIRKLLTSESCYSLHTLKLNNNGLGIGGGEILSTAFLECHKTSSSLGKPFALKVFISGRNRLEDKGAKALSKAFKVLGSLEHIEIPQNGIRPDGVQDLANAFQENRNLKVININDNTCTETGAKAIAKCIPNLKMLQILNVGDCLLKNAGALALAPALATDITSLKEVIMSFNEIRIEGALAIAKSMENKINLSSLNLDGNQLGEGTEEVEEVMSSFGMIKVLAPFDDNEDPDSDDENGCEEDDSYNNNENDEAADDLISPIKNIGLSKDTYANGDEKSHSHVDHVRSFFSTPSLETWKRVEKSQRKDSLKTVIDEDIWPDLDKICFTYVHSSSAVEGDNEAVEELATMLLRPAFTSDLFVTDRLVSSLLIHMGLLKAELKIEKVSSLKGPLQGLQSIIMEDYFPKSITAHFIAFLMKPNRLLDACSTERHNLLAKLYQK